MNRLSAIATFCVFLFFSCGNGNVSHEEMLAGEKEKTWEATRETNAQGDREKLSREEKKERITFWRNGDVRMGDDNQAMTGKWTLQGNTLSINFTGANVSENFGIVSLEKNEVVLRAGDGSQLVMKPD